MDEDRLRMLDDPRAVGDEVGMLSGKLVLQCGEVAERCSVRFERALGSVKLHPLRRPIGVRLSGNQAERAGHREFVIADDRGGLRMLTLQGQQPIEHSFRISATIDEVADEDDPAARVVRQPTQLIEDRVELFDLSMHVANDGNRTLNASGKAGHGSNFKNGTRGRCRDNSGRSCRETGAIVFARRPDTSAVDEAVANSR